MEKAFADMRAEAFSLLTGLRGELLAPDAFLRAHDRRDFVLEAKLYAWPAEGGDDDDEVLFAPHADLTSLTLLYAEGAGLQAWDEERAEWWPVGSSKGELVVNTGEFARLASHGALRNTVHRVVRGAKGVPGERVSIVLFAAPNWDASIADLVGGVVDTAWQLQSQEHNGVIAAGGVARDWDDLVGDWMPPP
jgi:isopenicillin N synthase-like dioxygenase